MLGAEPLLAGVFSPSGRLSGDRARELVERALGEGATSASLGPLTLALAPGAPQVSERTLAAVGSASVEVPPDGPEGLGGPSVLARWDETTRRGLLAGDAAGAAPLFVIERDGSLLFASEVRLLLGLLPRRPEPDVAAMARWLASGASHQGATLYAGVRRLGAARAIELTTAGWSEHTWRELRPHPVPGDPASVLRAAVAARCAMPAGTPAVVQLSGGLDSSVVAALLARDARARDVPGPIAVTATFPDHPELDESEHAAAVADFWGLELRRVPLRPRPLLEYADRYEDAVGLPLAYPSMAYFAPLLDAAREAGGEIVLDGEGGDELFGAEPFLVADRLRRGNLLGALRLAGRVPGVGRPVTPRALRRVMRQWGLRGAVPLAIHERRPRPAAPQWMRPEVAAALRDDPWAWKRAPGPRWRAHLSYSLTSARDEFRVRDELRRTAALAGVRSHHPLLDPGLSELILGLPPEEAFHPRHDRWLLRRAMTGLLPRSVLEREDKPAFGSPITESLLEHDEAAIAQRLSAIEPAISAVVRMPSIRGMPGQVREHPGRRSTLEFWRMLTLERWLSRQG